VGNDTLTFEMRPPIVTAPVFQVFPVHMLLIADNGIHIIENFDLEELAAAEVYDSCWSCRRFKVRGGTGSALRFFRPGAGRPRLIRVRVRGASLGRPRGEPQRCGEFQLTPSTIRMSRSAALPSSLSAA
jgi:hypothetical protein